MSGPRFHQTRMGQRFYEHTAPEMVRQLTRLNDLLDRLVERLPAEHSGPPPHTDRKDEGQR